VPEKHSPNLNIPLTLSHFSCIKSKFESFAGLSDSFLTSILKLIEKYVSVSNLFPQGFPQDENVLRWPMAGYEPDYQCD